MSSFVVDNDRFRLWLDAALLANTTMHVERRQLWEDLTKLTKEETKGDKFTLPVSSFLRLKQFLTARSDKISSNDALSLNYSKLIESLADAVNKDPVASGSSLPSQPSVELKSS